MRIDIKRGRQAMLALLTTSALAGGVLAAGPAQAAGVHTVTVQANPGISGLIGSISCSDPNAVGADFNDSTALNSTGRGTFTGVPDGYSCSAFARENQPEDTDFATYSWSGSPDTVISNDATVLSPNGIVRTDIHCTNFSTVAGTLAVTQTVSAVLAPLANGVFDSSTVTYDWFRIDYRGGYPVFTPVQTSAAHNSAQYTLTEADFGHQIEVDIAGLNTARTDGDSCVGAISAPVGRLGAPAPGRPGIRGKAVVGKRLAARSATPPAGSSVAGYQWYYQKVVKSGSRKKVVLVKIRGASHSVYRVKKRDKGKFLVVGITYTRPSFNPTVLLSRAKKVK